MWNITWQFANDINHTSWRIENNLILYNGTIGLYNSSYNSEYIENPLNYGVLALILIILATIVGNVLVCLAVCWEKRLQNMTNYFLMSLAIADLLVSLLVMPLGMIVELFIKQT